MEADRCHSRAVQTGGKKHLVPLSESPRHPFNKHAWVISGVGARFVSPYFRSFSFSSLLPILSSFDPCQTSGFKQNTTGTHPLIQPWSWNRRVHCGLWCGAADGEERGTSHEQFARVHALLRVVQGGGEGNGAWARRNQYAGEAIWNSFDRICF